MSDEMFIEKLASRVGEVPEKADIISLKKYSLDEIQQRSKRVLEMIQEVSDMQLKRQERTIQEDRTLVRMPLGAQLSIYNSSGAMKFSSGFNPMDFLFKEVESQEKLTNRVEKIAGRLNIRELVGENESLNFERLWQIKAAAADQKGNVVSPVLCRIVGAYRHFVSGFPVWGAASVAIKLAGEDRLDSLAVQIREPNGEVVGREKILQPEDAARRAFLQLNNLMHKSEIPVSELVKPKGMHFGYFSLSKRKAQRILAPVYIAEISVEGKDESQAYVFVLPATEKRYIPLSFIGSEAPPTLKRNE